LLNNWKMRGSTDYWIISICYFVIKTAYKGLGMAFQRNNENGKVKLE
jgi:hypothetical protein